MVNTARNTPPARATAGGCLAAVSCVVGHVCVSKCRYNHRHCWIFWCEFSIFKATVCPRTICTACHVAKPSVKPNKGLQCTPLNNNEATWDMKKHNRYPLYPIAYLQHANANRALKLTSRYAFDWVCSNRWNARLMERAPHQNYTATKDTLLWDS